MSSSTIPAELISTFGGNALTVYCRFSNTPEHLVAAVRYLCEDGIDVNYERDHCGRNALLAFLDNYEFIEHYPESALEIVNVLVSSGSRVRDERDDDGEDAFWKLIKVSNDPKILFPFAQVLLENGADINAINPTARINAAISLLSNRDYDHFCEAQAGNPKEEAYYLHKLIELFLFYGLDLNKTKNFLNFLLCDRAKHEPIFVETVKLALKFGAEINYNGDNSRAGCLIGCCLFVHAGASKIYDLLKLLIDHGINVNQTNAGLDALTSFLISIDSLGPGEMQVISLLCESGIDVNRKCKVFVDDGSVDALPLVFHLYEKFDATACLSIARILIARGANVDTKDFQMVFLPLLSLYVSQRYFPSLSHSHRNVTEHRTLIASDSESNEYYNGPITVSEWVRERISKNFSKLPKLPPSKEEWYELVKFLLENGVKFNMVFHDSEMNAFGSFITFYEGKDFIKIIELFCEHGAYVNKRFIESDSKIMNVIDYLFINPCQKDNHQKAVMLLLDHGLNVTFVRPEHRTMYLQRLMSKKHCKHVIRSVEIRRNGSSL